MTELVGRRHGYAAPPCIGKSTYQLLIVANDVHPPFQLIEGVELRALERVEDRARRVLEEGTDVSIEDGISTEMPSESTQQEQSELTFGSGGLVQTTA